MRNRITKSQGDEIFVGGYGVDSGVVMWLIVNQIGLGSTTVTSFLSCSTVMIPVIEIPMGIILNNQVRNQYIETSL